jgi:hypothetical protein
MKPPITHKRRMNGKVGRCELCQLETVSGSSFCPTHTRADKNLREGYDAWNIAYGNVALATYFARLIKLPESGGRVKELVRFYQNNPGWWK